MATCGWRDQRRADRLAVAGDHVEDAGREDVGGELGEAERRQRRLLGRLEDRPCCRPRAPGRSSRPPSSAGSSRARSRPRRPPARGGSSRCSRSGTRPPALPSMQRAAPAKKRRLSTTNGISLRRARAACRRSRIRAPRARRRRASIRSASLSSSPTRARPALVAAPAVERARRAAATARSTSSSAADRHAGDTASVAGVRIFSVAPSAAATASPLTNIE